MADPIPSGIPAQPPRICYVIAFEVAKELAPVLNEALKSFKRYCPITPTCWAILSDKTPAEIRDTLSASLGPKDRLFVIRSGTAAAWRNLYGEKNSAWLKANL